MTMTTRPFPLLAVVGASTVVLAALAGCMRARPAPLPEDVCVQDVPAMLRPLLAKSYPRHRIALSTDQHVDGDEAWNRLYDRRDSCATVAHGDFDGDGREDTALFLASLDGAAPKLVVALARPEGWSLAELPAWNARILGAYVQRVGPGTYLATESAPSGGGDARARDRVVLATDGLVAGREESTGVVYGWEQAAWVFVWVSD